MGFKDQIQKLMQPFEGEDEDIYEGARKNANSQPAPKAASISMGFEQFFADEPMEAEEEEKKVEKKPAAEGGILGGFKKAAKPRAQRERTVDFGGQDSQVILFNPKTFEDATELVAYLEQRRSLVLSLEGAKTEPRRLLDFISGIAIALQSKITPISGKTYFITPRDVDVLGAQGELAESDGQYL